MFLRGDAEEHIPVGSRRAIHGAPRPAPEHRQDAQYHRPPCAPVVACTGVQRSRRAPLWGMERRPGAHCRPRHRPQPQHPRPRRDRGVGWSAALLRKPGQRNITRSPAGCSVGPRSQALGTPKVRGACRGDRLRLLMLPLRACTTVGGAVLPSDVPARGVARHGWRASSSQGCALQRPRGGTSEGSPVPVMTARARSGVSTRWRPPRTAARPRASPPPPRRRGACRAARARAASPC